MTFYSGFSLRDESHFFEPYLKKSDFTVAGFSYGAIKALLHVSQSHERVDTLQLFSPAFFQTQSERFKRLQLMGYHKDPLQYLERFLQSCFAPYPAYETLHVKHNELQLRELLYYEWDTAILANLQKRGIAIEVYLGGNDAVIDAEAAKAFFLPFATTYLIKKANHFLLEE